MRKNFGPHPWSYPQPVFIIATYGEDGTPDAMNAEAFRGMAGAGICHIELSSGAIAPFYDVLDFPHKARDIVSLARENGVTVAVECRFVSYDPETCRMVGEIVNISADDSILDAQGNIDPAKLRPITFDPVNQTYLVLGEKVGNAFADGLELK